MSLPAVHPMHHRRPVAADESPDYNDRNIELFTRRLEIQRQLAEAEAKHTKKPTGRTRAELARLRRVLDDVTTEIVQFNWGLVRNYVKQFTSNTSREDSADFESAGVVGLMRAIDSFDPSKGRFGQWAYKPIQREVLRAVRDADYPNLNPGDFERRPDVLAAAERLRRATDDVDYRPSREEIAAEAGVTIDQVRRILDAPRLDSLDMPVGDDGDSRLGDLIEDPDPDIESSVVTSMSIEALETYGLTALDSRELLVLVRRFGLDCEPEQKLAGIGDMLGLSREAVRQVEAKALAKIQHPVVLRKMQRHGRA